MNDQPTIASVPENLGELNAAETAKLFRDPPEGIDLPGVLDAERQRDEPRKSVLTAAVAAGLLDQDEADRLIANAAARRSAGDEGPARFPAARIAANVEILASDYTRPEIVGAFHDAGIEDDDELTQEEARGLIEKWRTAPVKEA